MAHQEQINRVVTQASQIILGKENRIRLALACILAHGHLLIEDHPGVGKTTLAMTLARLLGLRYQRIQFTSDLLPADILGVSIFDRETTSFRFHPGPIFCQLVLADEVNRATPKTQSALLEAMEEKQVTLDGETRPLPSPFFVIATQNPEHQTGTFPLPESQLDRFLMRLDLGFPDPQAERELLQGEDRRLLVHRLQPCLLPGELEQLQTAVQKIGVSPALLDYVQALIAFTRHSPHFRHGLSPRAGLAILAAAKAWALMEKHPSVLPEDVQAVLPGIVNHRLFPRSGDVREVASLLITAVAIP
ncbi:MAG: AAA domain-containing protein [Magnetococcales bacterium]|nr:AAA family ATPase [Magnetococcales bacterium]NGZ27304.1 AAA domain-containing protein [Magnetococcales bacterium]